MAMGDHADLPIGFMDSGVGGIAVLRSAIAALPNEDFIFYGDIGHAPYGNGDRSDEEIRAIAMDAVEYVYGKGIKALVVACNTATSAAIEEVRAKYPQIPVLGMEPAVKPACEALPGRAIGVMATPSALGMERFQRQLRRFHDVSEIISLPCSGLSRLIETAEPGGDEVDRYLRKRLESYPRGALAGVVVGCTHYVFVEERIAALTGARIFDGLDGTIRHLARRLREAGIEARRGGRGRVTLLATPGSEEQLPLFERFYNF